jgi:hypothetical protein
MYAGAYDEEDNDMQLNLKFPKTELLAKLKENREAHEEMYKKAHSGYMEAVAERLRNISTEAQAMAIQFDNGKEHSIDRTTFFVDEEKPKSHVDAYDQAIEMLEFTTQSEIELSQDHFKQLVQDKWDWKHSFMAASAKYSG